MHSGYRLAFALGLATFILSCQAGSICVDQPASGDAAAIDGNPATYWDEFDSGAVYRLQVELSHATHASAISLTGGHTTTLRPRTSQSSATARS